MKRAIAALALVAFVLLSLQSTVPAITTEEGEVLLCNGAPLVVRDGGIYTQAGEELTTISGKRLTLGVTQVEAPGERLGARVSLVGIKHGFRQVVTEDGRAVFYFREGRKLVTYDFEEVVAGGRKLEVEAGYALTQEHKRLLQIFTLSAALLLISDVLAGAFGLLALLLSFGYADLSRAVFRDALVFYLAYSFVLSTYSRGCDAAGFVSAFLKGAVLTEERCSHVLRRGYAPALAAGAILLPVSSFYNMFLLEFGRGSVLRWLSYSAPIAVALLLLYLLASKLLGQEENPKPSIDAKSILPAAFVLLAGSVLGYGVAALLLATALMASGRGGKVDPSAISYAFLLAVLVLLQQSGAGFYLGKRLISLSSLLPLSSSATTLLAVMLPALILGNLLGKGYALAIVLPVAYGTAKLAGQEFFVLGMAALVASSLQLGSEKRDVAAIVYAFGFLITLLFLMHVG